MTAFIFSGEVATMPEMLNRAGGPCDVVVSMAWAPSAAIMMRNLVELIRTTDVPEGKTVMIITDPMGVVMRDAANNRINVDGPKEVFWYSHDPDHMYCRHPANGQVGKHYSPVRTHAMECVDTNTGHRTETAATPNNADNRAELIAHARTKGCTQMSDEIAGGVLTYKAMRPGPAKTEVQRLAQELADRYPAMHDYIAIGCAYLIATERGVVQREEAEQPEHPMNTEANRAEVMAESRARGGIPMTNSIAGALLMYGTMPPGTAKDDVEALAHRLRATYPGMDIPTALGGAYLTITQMGPATFRAPEAPPNRRARRARRD
jgi:hypothetical protein